MSGLTPKQEQFALKYLETGNASEAYRRSYAATGMKPPTVHRAAFSLLENPKVAARLEELKERARRRHDVTIDSITEELVEDRRFAREHGSPAAALSATLGKARLHGLMSDGGVFVTVATHVPEKDKRLLDEYAAAAD